MKRLGGLRGFLATVITVALVAPSLGTAWTSRTQTVVSLVDPSLRAGEVALVHTSDGHAGALSSKLAVLGATDIETEAAANTVIARLSADALAAIKTDARVILATSDTQIVASGDRRNQKGVFENAKLNDRNGDNRNDDGLPASLVAMNAPFAWTRTTGEGVTVAIMDSGIADHPDLEGKVRARINFVNDGNTQLDPGGHGTFLAGLVAADGGMRGVAPDAKLVSLRVLDANGNGTLRSVVKAFDWLLANGKRNSVKVVSISWGAPEATTYHKSLLSALVEAAWFSGVTVVAAAGNEGPDAGTVTSPASDPFVIAVGSYNDMGTPSTSDDVMSTFSSRGPTLDGFAKPDTLAPGEHVRSLRVSGLTYLDSTGAPVGSPTDRYIHMSGTSASAGLASGVAALVKSARPSFRPNDIKGAMLASGRAMAGTTATALDAFGALTRTGTANANLAPSRLLLMLLASAHQLRVKGVSWEGVSWDSVSWDGISWETISWETVNWEAVTWETVTWEGVSWEDVVISE
jgi:subtilisin family serine protease